MNSGQAFAALRSEHVSDGSGGIEVRYPGEWEGRIEAAVSSGCIKIQGSGVVVDEEGPFTGGRVRAHKGEGGESRIEARSGSGGVRVDVG